MGRRGIIGQEFPGCRRRQGYVVVPLIEHFSRIPAFLGLQQEVHLKASPVYLSMVENYPLQPQFLALEELRRVRK